jgi:hypothetical protein
MTTTPPKTTTTTDSNKTTRAFLILSLLFLCFVLGVHGARARFTSCFLDKVSSSRPKIVFFFEISLNPKP